MSLAPATEIVVSLMSQHADEQGNQQLHDDPRTYIYKTTSITIPGDIDVEVVENTDRIVNLALPYYGNVDKKPPRTADDNSMKKVNGGILHPYFDIWSGMNWDDVNNMNGANLGHILATSGTDYSFI